MSAKKKAPAPSKIDETAATVTAARIRLGLTQAAFAQLLETPIGTVRGWEQGRRKPPPCAMLLMRIAVEHPEVLLAGAQMGSEAALKAEKLPAAAPGKKASAAAVLHEPGDDTAFWLL